MMGVLEMNIDQLPKILFSAMLVHLASKKLKKVPRGRAEAAILDLHGLYMPDMVFFCAVQMVCLLKLV